MSVVKRLPLDREAADCCSDEPLSLLADRPTASGTDPDGLPRFAVVLSSEGAALLGCFFSAFCFRKASSCNTWVALNTVLGADQSHAERTPMLTPVIGLDNRCSKGISTQYHHYAFRCRVHSFQAAQLETPSTCEVYGPVPYGVPLQRGPSLSVPCSYWPIKLYSSGALVQSCSAKAPASCVSFTVLHIVSMFGAKMVALHISLHMVS